MNYDYLLECSNLKTPISFSFKINRKKLFLRANIKFYFDNGHQYASITLQNISEEKMKDFDKLTGCMSRTCGINLINTYIKNHPIDKMALIILDLDGFKSLNDTYGHPMGDKVLAKMHSAFNKLPVDYRYSTRLGGDEFALLLKNRKDVYTNDKIISDISKALAGIGREVGLDKNVNCSCGIALIPEDGSNFYELYPTADNSLYNHKKSKKNNKS